MKTLILIFFLSLQVFSQSNLLLFGDDVLTLPDDGSNVAFYDYKNTETIIADGTAVTDWVNSIAGADTLEQKTNTLYRPTLTADGISFDGSNDLMKTDAFTYAQPLTIYIVVKQVTWTDIEYIFDGNAASSMALYQRTSTPNIRLIAGGQVLNNNTATIGDFQIITCVFNGASSSLQVNDLERATGTIGSGAGGGFTLGSDGAGSGASNIVVKGVLLRSGNDVTNSKTDIYKNFLKSYYGISF